MRRQEPPDAVWRATPADRHSAEGASQVGGNLVSPAPLLGHLAATKQGKTAARGWRARWPVAWRWRRRP